MMKQLANLLCVIICHFALPAPGLKILSILSAAGDGCPSKRSVSLESSAVNKTTNSSAASLMFADMTPQAVLSQGAVASRWCEVELELEVPENDPFVARLDGVVQYGMGFSVNSQGQGLQVTTSLEWSWDKSQKVRVPGRRGIWLNRDLTSTLSAPRNRRPRSSGPRRAPGGGIRSRSSSRSVPRYDPTPSLRAVGRRPLSLS